MKINLWASDSINIFLLFSVFQFIYSSEADGTQKLIIDGVRRDLSAACSPYLDARTRAWTYFLPVILDASLFFNRPSICDDFVNKFCWGGVGGGIRVVADIKTATGAYKWYQEDFGQNEYPVVVSGHYECAIDGRFTASVDDVWPAMVANDHILPVTIPGAEINYTTKNLSITSILQGLKKNVDSLPYRPALILGGYGFVDFLQEANAGLADPVRLLPHSSFSWENYPAPFNIPTFGRDIAMSKFSLTLGEKENSEKIPLVVSLKVPRLPVRVELTADRVGDTDRLKSVKIDLGELGCATWIRLDRGEGIINSIERLRSSWKDGLPSIVDGSISQIDASSWIRDPTVVNSSGFASRVKFYHAVHLFSPDVLLRWFSLSVKNFEHNSLMRDYVEFECAFFWLARYRHFTHATVFKQRLLESYQMLSIELKRKVHSAFTVRAKRTVEMYGLGKNERKLFDEVADEMAH